MVQQMQTITTRYLTVIVLNYFANLVTIDIIAENNSTFKLGQARAIPLLAKGLFVIYLSKHLAVLEDALRSSIHDFWEMPNRGPIATNCLH